ncbi:MAG TPA: M3 family oligoendopeptidase [Candidatus Acidoferrales bacterium]|nr:M3 family oligoendopeptidase [Candidatus Acidoferrales bacterium]
MSSSNLPRWDLSNVYPGLESDELRKSFVELKTQLEALDAFLDKNKVSRTVSPSGLAGSQVRPIVEGYLDRTNASLRLYATMNAYVSSFVSTDSYNSTAKRLESELDMIGVRFHQQETRFRGWIGLAKDSLDPLLTVPGTIKDHAFYLRETVEQSRYLMSEPEEALAAELELSGSTAWSKLQGTISSQITVNFELNGKSQSMPITTLQNLNHHPNPDVRRRAYEAEMSAWESVRESLAAALNGIKGSKIVIDKKRGRIDSLHASLDTSRIDRETLDTLLSVMKESFPTFRRYLKAKAKKLGTEKLPWWDLFAAVGKNERRYSWPDAMKFILAQFHRFDERLEKLAQRAFDHRWIDAEPRNGKRGGAFCMDVPGVDESRILCNFDGSLDQVSTVAHELGHAFHNECLVGKKILQTGTPMTLAETASIMNETIISNAALSQATTTEEELAILETSLSSSTQVIVDITSRFMFEKEVCERRAQSELSADDFCEIMLRSQKATYGDGLDERYLNKYMWAWKVHYYIPSFSFYNYPYAFGLLFGTGLYSLYRKRGQPFVKDYEALLSSTGEANPAELAERFDIDIRKPQFWRDSIDVLAQQIDRFVKL